MKYLIKKAIMLLITISIFILISLIYTFLIYNEKINTNSSSIYKTSLIIGAIIFFIFGLLNSLFENRRFLLYTTLYTTFILLLLLLFKYLSNSIINNFIYLKYLIYLFSSVLGVFCSFIFRKKYPPTSK